MTVKTIATILSIVGSGTAITYGAYTDWKNRIIPNIVPITVFLCGLIYPSSIQQKLFGLILVGGVLWVLQRNAKQKSGGGDLKLYCAIAFSYGLFALSIMLVLTLIYSYLGSFILEKMGKGKRIEKSTRIPVCTAFAPSYWTFMLMLIIFSYIL